MGKINKINREKPWNKKTKRENLLTLKNTWKIKITIIRSIREHNKVHEEKLYKKLINKRKSTWNCALHVYVISLNGYSTYFNHSPPSSSS